MIFSFFLVSKFLVSSFLHKDILCIIYFPFPNTRIFERAFHLFNQVEQLFINERSHIQILPLLSNSPNSSVPSSKSSFVTKPHKAKAHKLKPVSIELRLWSSLTITFLRVFSSIQPVYPVTFNGSRTFRPPKSRISPYPYLHHATRNNLIHLESSNSAVRNDLCPTSSLLSKEGPLVGRSQDREYGDKKRRATFEERSIVLPGEIEHEVEYRRLINRVNGSRLILLFAPWIRRFYPRCN